MKNRIILILVFAMLVTFWIRPVLAQHAGMNIAASEPAQNIPAADKDQNVKGQGVQEKSLVDHKAVVFNTGGESLILRKGDSNWKPLAKDEMIGEGDQVKTGKDSFVEISYDEFYLNIARIGTSTISEFRSIEPTDIYIADGGIFNDLEGLTKGSTYEVATPTSVAGVRGTEFLRAFDAQTGTDTTICDRGAVEVFLINAAGDMMPEARIQVEGGKVLEINSKVIAEAVAKENFEAVKPVEMTPEHHQRMGEMTQTKENLAQFVGDPQIVAKMHEMFSEMKKDPEKMARIMSEMWKKDREAFGGPNDPNDPNSGGPNDPNDPNSGGPNDPNDPDSGGPTDPNDPNGPNNGVNPRAADSKNMDPRNFDPKNFDHKNFDPKNFDHKNFDSKNFDPKNFDSKNFDPARAADPGQNTAANRNLEAMQPPVRDYHSWGRESSIPDNNRGPATQETKGQPSTPIIQGQHLQEQMKNQTQQIQQNVQQQMQQNVQQQMQQNVQQQMQQNMQSQMQQNMQQMQQNMQQIQQQIPNNMLEMMRHMSESCRNNPGTPGCQ